MMARRRNAVPEEPNEEALGELESYVAGLYVELDKLSKKMPNAAITDYAAKRVNAALAEAKAQLGPFDRYAQELGPFVAAGTNPDVQDALLAMREIKQALARVQSRFDFDILDAFR